MKSTKYLIGLLQKVFEDSDMNADLEPIISELKNGLTDRDTHLTALGEYTDAENGTDVSFSARETNPPGMEWQEKYNELKGRYVERFFNGDAAAANVDDATNAAEIIRAQNADIREDSTPDISDLFE